MTQKKNQNILYTQTQITYMVIQWLNFFQQIDSNRYILKSLINNIILAPVQKDVFLTWSSISKRIARITYLLSHTLAPDKIEIKGEMSEYQLKIADLGNIRIGNVIKLVPTFFVKVYALLWKVTTLLKTRIKTKKIHRVFLNLINHNG